MDNRLSEMWEALCAYQEQADADGHGESWRTGRRPWPVWYCSSCTT